MEKLNGPEIVDCFGKGGIKSAVNLLTNNRNDIDLISKSIGQLSKNDLLFLQTVFVHLSELKKTKEIKDVLPEGITYSEAVNLMSFTDDQITFLNNAIKSRFDELKLIGSGAISQKAETIVDQLKDDVAKIL